MSKTGSRLDAILDEWAYEIENSPPNRPIRMWVGHFHKHTESLSNPGFEDVVADEHECIGVVISGSRLKDVPVSLAAYLMSEEVTCSALAFQTREREIIVSHTDTTKQWRVTWSLDDYGKVSFKHIRPTIHFGSRRLLSTLKRSKLRGGLTLQEAVEMIHLLTREREENDD